MTAPWSVATIEIIEVSKLLQQQDSGMIYMYICINKIYRVKGALQLLSTALSKFALLRYLSEIRFQVLTAISPRFIHESGTIRKKQAIDVSKLKRLLCYESQHQSQRNEKS